jgi:hypothetical protein
VASITSLLQNLWPRLLLLLLLITQEVVILLQGLVRSDRTCRHELWASLQRLCC